MPRASTPCAAGESVGKGRQVTDTDSSRGRALTRPARAYNTSVKPHGPCPERAGLHVQGALKKMGSVVEVDPPKPARLPLNTP